MSNLVEPETYYIRIRKFRTEAGNIAESLLRAFGLLAACGVMFSFILSMWRMEEINAMSYLYIFGLVVACITIFFLSAGLFLGAILEMEARLNVKNDSIIFWIFGFFAIITVFAITGASAAFILSLK